MGDVGEESPMSDPNRVGVGDALPPIVLADLEGRPVSLSSHHHQRKLIVFMWASW